MSSFRFPARPSVNPRIRQHECRTRTLGEVVTVNYRKATKYAVSLTSEQQPFTGLQLQPPLLVPVREAARLLSVSTWEIRRLCRRGALRYKKLGRTKWLVTSKSIEAFASEENR